MSLSVTPEQFDSETKSAVTEAYTLIPAQIVTIPQMNMNSAT